MNWRVGEAKQRFSEVLRSAASEPQLIYNRDRLVAAVVEPSLFDQFERWRKDRQQQTLGERFEELRRIEEEEGWELELPARRDRRNPFAP